MLDTLALALSLSPLAVGGYAYGIYPIALSALARRGRNGTPDHPPEWPSVTIVIPVFNEVHLIAQTLDHVLALDYPRDRLQVLVVSDASSDGTDDVVREYAARGVELLRMPVRRGKTAGENAAGSAARGDVVVNLDASIRISGGALRALVRAFADPEVGVASGRDVTVGRGAAAANRGERRYTDYEMRIRAMETRVRSIVGASGCFFASRRALYQLPFPEALSRDFGSALVAQLHGYRAVSVDDAVCLVPLTPSLAVEQRRKMRTMTRGLGTLWHMRRLLDPTRFGVFAWMLFSHKLCRWLVPVTVPLSIVGLTALSATAPTPWMTVGARAGLATVLTGAAAGWLGLRLARHGAPPRLLALPAFVVGAIGAGLRAWTRALSGRGNPTWEPTRRLDVEVAARV